MVYAQKKDRGVQGVVRALLSPCGPHPKLENYSRVLGGLAFFVYFIRIRIGSQNVHYHSISFANGSLAMHPPVFDKRIIEVENGEGIDIPKFKLDIPFIKIVSFGGDIGLLNPALWKKNIKAYLSPK